jgi:hypothetical protein
MISINQATIKLNISDRRIRALCNQGRIPGAQLIGGTWVLPDDPKITAGTRTRPGKAVISESGKI